MASAEERRARYESAVRGLAQEVQTLGAQGLDEESVARVLVARRNAIKADVRAGDPPEIVLLMEARNRQKYGNPLGPDADWFFAKYQSWRAVIEAACRPADLKP